MKVTGSSIEQLEKDKPRARCRRWRLWVSTDCGRRSRRFRGTWTEAQDALRAFVTELEATIPDSESFASYAESWRLWREASGYYTANSVKEDRRKVRALLRTPLAGMKIAEITPEDCRSALLWLKSHKVDGGSYTGTSMQKFHGALHSIMQQAEDDGRIARNPMAKLKPPRVDTERRDALSPMELQLFLNRVDELPVDGRTMAVYLMACLGLRRGEACALLDADVHDGYAHVRYSMSEQSRKPGRTKSEAGNRTLPIPPRLQERIDLWRDCRRALGFPDAEYLCCNTLGGAMLPQNLWRWWRGVAPELGCEGMTLHDLRHANLSMMARHMSVFDLQRYAGWASIEPARIYVHDDLESVTRASLAAWDALSAPYLHQA